MTEKILIIGGVAAGAGAATKARRNSEAAEIIMLEKGDYVSFANCGLPYYVGEDIKDREDLLLITPQAFKAKFNIDVRINNEAIAIDPQKKVVTIVRKGNQEYEETYDKLIIATGNAPIVPPIPGVDLGNIYNLWTINDVDKIKVALADVKLQQALVIGGGFVGLEAVEALLNLDFKVSLVEKADHIMPPLDGEMALMLEKHLREKGVNVVVGNGVTKFTGTDKVTGAELEDGSVVEADLVIMAIGARPRVELAKKAGLEIGETGGIVVDEFMRTSTADIYAAGDIVESLHLVSGQRVKVPLAGPANKQGRVAGANAVGGTMEFKGVLGTSIVKACDITAAKTGLSEKELKDLGWNYTVSYTNSAHHATYYPGAQRMIVKLIFRDEDGLILGAQIVGSAGVDKRIDVFAAAIYSGLTVEDLEDFDLAYAPPYGSAKDPVIMAGMVAANIYRQEVKAITPLQLAKLLENDEEIQLIDVRLKDAFEKGAITEAINIPISSFRQEIEKLDKNKVTVPYCNIGYNSYLAYKILEHHGFANVYNLSGGFSSWTAFKD